MIEFSSFYHTVNTYIYSVNLNTRKKNWKQIFFSSNIETFKKKNSFCPSQENADIHAKLEKAVADLHSLQRQNNDINAMLEDLNGWVAFLIKECSRIKLGH